MYLAFFTIVVWEVIAARSLIFSLKIWNLYTSIDLLSLFSIIASLVEMSGSIWLFWSICLSLFVTDEALEARQAIGRRLRRTPALQQLIDKWRNKPRPKELPPDPLGGLSFILREPLSWLFGEFCRLYLVPKNNFLQVWLWVVAEIIFPFRSGSILLSILLIIGVINVILDMVGNGLGKTWGFGQLLPTFMLLLPFFSLAQAYASKSSHILQII
jgi:hypothetical protein